MFYSSKILIVPEDSSLLPLSPEIFSLVTKFLLPFFVNLFVYARIAKFKWERRNDQSIQDVIDRWLI